MGSSYEVSEEKEEIECAEGLNDLSLDETEMLKLCIEGLKSSINKKKFKDSIRYCNWLEEN